jgi:hypothetical protein
MDSHALCLLDEHVLRSYSRSTAVPSPPEQGFLTYGMNVAVRYLINNHLEQENHDFYAKAGLLRRITPF